MGLLFTDDYADAAPILRILSIYVFILVIGFVAAQYVVSKGMQKTYFASIVLGGSVSVLCCFLLIPELGGKGATLALVAGHGTTISAYVAATLYSLREQGKNISQRACDNSTETDVDKVLECE